MQFKSKVSKSVLHFSVESHGIFPCNLRVKSLNLSYTFLWSLMGFFVQFKSKVSKSVLHFSVESHWIFFVQIKSKVSKSVLHFSVESHGTFLCKSRVKSLNLSYTLCGVSWDFSCNSRFKSLNLSYTFLWSLMGFFFVQFKSEVSKSVLHFSVESHGIFFRAIQE